MINKQVWELLKDSNDAPILKVDLEHLRPTQCACGWQEVAQKEKEMLIKMQEGKWESYLRKKTIPVIAAPNGKMYLVDRHHMALALLHLADAWDWGIEKKGSNPYQYCYVRIVADERGGKWDKKGFYQHMEQQGMLYPFNEDGQRVRIREIPYSIGDLKDDPFRALAGFARKMGAYKKVPIPYTEFAWAQYYRSILSKTMVKNDMRQALRLVLALSWDPKAQHLPGYEPQRVIGSQEQIEKLMNKVLGADVHEEGTDL